MPEIVGPEGLASGAVIIDGHDDAIMGISWNHTLIYDREAIVAALMKRDGMTRPDADGFLEFNIEPLADMDGGFILVERI